MNPVYSEFKRCFSLSMYKNLKIKLGEMSFLKDFVNDNRGDLYPVIEKSEDLREKVGENLYTIEKGWVKRLFCSFFPYATYELSARAEGGAFGFAFTLAEAEVKITLEGEKLIYSSGESSEAVDCVLDYDRTTLIVSLRPGAFDVYIKRNEKAVFLHTFKNEGFNNSDDSSLFKDGKAMVYAKGTAAIYSVSSYMDNGVSLADMRPIKYENGDVFKEQGKIYLTASIRMQEGTHQGIFSWIPGTAEFQMTGALFYDCGDGRWRNYVAPSILYHREKKLWYVWVSAFAHEAVLAYGSLEGDIRFGVNVADVRLMEKAGEERAFSDFVGFKGDEDPDFFYDEEKGKWFLAICRLNPETKHYTYAFFESDEPFSGYEYIGKGENGAETGGSFVKVMGERFFICGNDFKERSEYRIYNKEGMKKARFNYPDGGFRGWGTVIPVKLGSRERCFWLTFDRHNGSDYNWSYGNIYCFEAF